MDEIQKYTDGEVLYKETRPVKRGIGLDTPNLAEKLLELADEQRKMAYCPYSKYSVGAALLCMDGSIYTGCNVETAAFVGICAERNALFKAISEGRKDFLAIAVSGGRMESSPEGCSPCGVCKQVLSEFVDPDIFMIVFREKDNSVQTVPFRDMLPYSFGSDNLK